MTEEERTDRSDWYVQVTSPGVPYSAIRVAFTREGVAEAVLMCKYLAQEWRKAFDAPSTPEEPHYEPFTGDDHQTHQSRAESLPAASGGVFCPDHHVEMRASAPQYNKDGDKFYHPLDEAEWHKDARGGLVKNHTLYFRLTVDADGESNQGRIIPQPAGAR